MWSYTGWGKSKFTVVHMENNTVNNTRVNFILYSQNCKLILALPCISLMANDDNIFYVLILYVFFVKMSMDVFCPFSNWIIFFYCWTLGVSYIFHCWICGLLIFSPIVCLFILLIGHFTEQKLLIWMRSNLSLLFF